MIQSAVKYCILVVSAVTILQILAGINIYKIHPLLVKSVENKDVSLGTYYTSSSEDGNCTIAVHYASNITILNDKWHALIHNKIYTYSAHGQYSPEHACYTISVLGAALSTKELGATPWYCLLWSTRSRSCVRRAPAHLVIGASPTRYRYAKFVCSYAKQESSLEYEELYVALTLCKADIPEHVYHIRGTDNFRIVNETESKTNFTLVGSTSHQDKVDFTVCLWSPLYNYSDYRRFVEWVEIHRLFGADKFIVYNESIRHELEPYLAYYQSLGIMEVLDWEIPSQMGEHDGKDMLYHLQNVLIRDCHLRTRSITRYMTGVDVDEVIVPRAPDSRTWAKMIEVSGCPENTSIYAAKHLYFGASWGTDPAIVTNRSAQHLAMMARTLQSTRYYDYPERTKLIVRPAEVGRMSIHEASHASGATCVLEVEVGALHHYRAQDIRKFRRQKGTTRDCTMHRYLDGLLSRVRAVHRDVRKKHDFVLKQND